MTEWTPARIEERLREAVAVNATLIGEDVRPGSGRQSKDIIGSAAATDALATTSADRAPEALSWLSWLDQDDGGIVLARLKGASWKAVTWRYGISRPTADRRWRYALALIAWRLNGNSTRTPSLRTLLGIRRAA